MQSTAATVERKHVACNSGSSAPGSVPFPWQQHLLSRARDDDTGKKNTNLLIWSRKTLHSGSNIMSAFLREIASHKYTPVKL
jgi:hypothetical protein